VAAALRDKDLRKPASPADQATPARLFYTKPSYRVDRALAIAGEIRQSVCQLAPMIEEPRELRKARDHECTNPK